MARVAGTSGGKGGEGLLGRAREIAFAAGRGLTGRFFEQLGRNDIPAMRELGQRVGLPTVACTPRDVGRVENFLANLAKSNRRSSDYWQAADRLKDLWGITEPKTSVQTGIPESILGLLGLPLEHRIPYDFPSAPVMVERALQDRLLKDDIDRLEKETGRPRDQIIREIGNEIWLIANKFSPNVLYSFLAPLEFFRRKNAPRFDWGEIFNLRRINVRYHLDGLFDLVELGKKHESVNIIYAGTHRSHGDYLYNALLFHFLDVLKKYQNPASPCESLLYEVLKGMDRADLFVPDLRRIMPNGRYFLPLIVAGYNLRRLPFLNKMLAFWVRRTYDGEPLKRAAFSAYVRTALQLGYQMLLFPEGGRMKDGRLGDMKLGSLLAAVDGLSIRRAQGEDVEYVLMGVWNFWDKLAKSEIGSYMRDVLGIPKGVETQLAASKALSRLLIDETGRAHISLLPPIPIGGFLESEGVKVEDFHKLPPEKKRDLLIKIGNLLRANMARHGIEHISRHKKVRLLAAALMYPSGHRKSVELTEEELTERLEMVYRVLSLNDDVRVHELSTPVDEMVKNAERFTDGLLKRTEDGLIELNRNDRAEAGYFVQPLIEATSPYSIAAIAMLMAMEGKKGHRVREEIVLNNFMTLAKIFSVPFPSNFSGTDADKDVFEHAIYRLQEADVIKRTFGGGKRRGKGHMLQFNDGGGNRKMIYTTAWVLRSHIEAYRDASNILGGMASCRKAKIPETELRIMFRNELIQKIRLEHPDLDLEDIAGMSVDEFIELVPFWSRNEKIGPETLEKREVSLGKEELLRKRLEILLRDAEMRGPWVAEDEVRAAMLTSSRVRNKYRFEEMIKTLINLGIMERKRFPGEEKSHISFNATRYHEKKIQMREIDRVLSEAERIISHGVGDFDGIYEPLDLPTDFTKKTKTNSI